MHPLFLGERGAPPLGLVEPVRGAQCGFLPLRAPGLDAHVGSQVGHGRQVGQRRAQLVVGARPAEAVNLELRLEVVLAGLHVAADLGGAVPLHLGEHLAGRSLLPVHDRASQAEASKVGVNPAHAHALGAAGKAQDHLGEGDHASGPQASSDDAHEASPLRGRGEHFLHLLRAGAVGRVVAGLHAGKERGQGAVVCPRQGLPLDAVMFTRQGNELGGIGSLREGNAHARILPGYWLIV